MGKTIFLNLLSLTSFCFVLMIHRYLILAKEFEIELKKKNNMKWLDFDKENWLICRREDFDVLGRYADVPNSPPAIVLVKHGHGTAILSGMPLISHWNMLTKFYYFIKVLNQNFYFHFFLTLLPTIHEKHQKSCWILNTWKPGPSLYKNLGRSPTSYKRPAP